MTDRARVTHTGGDRFPGRAIVALDRRRRDRPEVSRRKLGVLVIAPAPQRAVIAQCTAMTMPEVNVAPILRIVADGSRSTFLRRRAEPELSLTIRAPAPQRAVGA